MLLSDLDHFLNRLMTLMPQKSCPDNCSHLSSRNKNLLIVYLLKVKAIMINSVCLLFVLPTTGRIQRNSTNITFQVFWFSCVS